MFEVKQIKERRNMLMSILSPNFITSAHFHLKKESIQKVKVKRLEPSKSLNSKNTFSKSKFSKRSSFKVIRKGNF